MHHLDGRTITFNVGVHQQHLRLREPGSGWEGLFAVLKPFGDEDVHLLSQGLFPFGLGGRAIHLPLLGPETFAGVSKGAHPLPDLGGLPVLIRFNTNHNIYV